MFENGIMIHSMCVVRGLGRFHLYIYTCIYIIPYTNLNPLCVYKLQEALI